MLINILVSSYAESYICRILHRNQFIRDEQTNNHEVTDRITQANGDKQIFVRLS